ncbi:MAG: DUF502 domain-containing protein [Verrucomicrobiota bacterium]|jgi:uncharacterized membrane protein|nr:MAG: DUF502 domain-containing protein [Verrucomicrobiota bacterium]
MPPVVSPIVKIRNGFFAGAILVAPLVVTVWAFSRIIDLVGGTFRPVFFFYLPDTVRNNPNLELIWDILATFLVIVTVTCLGLISRAFFAKVFLGTAERFIQGIPGVGAVYNTVKQVVDTFGKQNRSLYNKVVLIEFPRKGAWTIAFLTNKIQGEAQQKSGEELWTVYVPTTPNPTGGYMIMVPAKEVIELDMNVGDGMKMLLSAGAFVPSWNKETSPQLSK